MNELFGASRAAVKDRYALLTPEGFVASYLPGWDKASCQVAIAPALGARFCLLLATLQSDGSCAGNTGTQAYLIYLIEGNGTIVLDGRRHRLETGSYVYLPAAKDVQLAGGSPVTRVLIFQKPYESLPGVSPPAAFVSHEREAKSESCPGLEGVQRQKMLPGTPGFDMAVALSTFLPGAALSPGVTQISERGLVMVRGQGICRLNTDWHPVSTGDVVWAAPYCPFWFAALGQKPASYIEFQDVNRDPV